MPAVDLGDRATVELGGTSRGGVLIDRLGVAETGGSTLGQFSGRKNLLIINQMDVAGTLMYLLCAAAAANRHCS